ncbi:MAG: pilus assembly protein TadG-related protein, partial [Selenomonadaceae bacterium]
MFRRPYATQQYGQTIVMFAIVVPVLLGMLGLAFDIGNIYYVQRGRLQNTADAAVLAGAYGLPDEKMAESIAQKYIELNPVNGTPKVSYQYSADNSKMTITLQLNVTAYFMRIFGEGFENRDITVTATAGAAGAKLPAYAMLSG